LSEEDDDDDGGDGLSIILFASIDIEVLCGELPDFVLLAWPSVV